MNGTEQRRARRRLAPATPILPLLAALGALVPAGGAAAPKAADVVAGGDLAASHQVHGPQYVVRDLPSLGGTTSEGRSIDNLGVVAGYSNLPGDDARHAVLWIDGQELDLETFGGPNSAVVFPGNNNRGLITGISETAEMDPLEEAWSCSAFFPGGLGEPTGHVCRGFVWQDGEMMALPTLGGTHSFATSANGRGQVIGWAENDVEDPTCVPPQLLQFRAVVWNPRTGALRDLPPFPGDSVGTANAINNKGQIVGISGDCGIAVGGVSARHAVLWENGKVTDLGNLGEDTWNTPLAINGRGEVVGFAGLATDFLGAFRWTEATGMQPLPKLKDDHVHSEAWGINNRGQVVGLSCDAAFADCRAFLWQDGAMTDLNDVVAPGTLHLRLGRAINDLGMITGQSVDAQTGERRAFLAIPTASHGQVAAE